MTASLGRELNGPRAITPDKVRIDPPAQVAVKVLGAIDIGNWDDSDLKLHVDCSRFRDFSRGFAARQNGVHLDLLYLRGCIRHSSDAQARFGRHRAENNCTKVSAIPLDCHVQPAMLSARAVIIGPTVRARMAVAVSRHADLF